MPRLKFVQIGKELRQVDAGYEPTLAPRKKFYINGDMQPFKSPIDGSVISGRSQRREHMKRNGVVDYAPSPTGRF